MDNLNRKAELLVKKHARRRLLQRAVAVPAAVVVFVTTYLLILPAIAMNRPTYCGLEEHTHNEHCAVSELTCGYQEGEITTTTVSSTVYDCDADVHVHDASCRNSAGELVCGYADYVVHKHNSNCYLNGMFVCDLPQIEAHTHDSSCYTTTTTLVCGQEESEGHTHTDECYTTETKTELTCGQEESAGHTHSDACYQNEVDEEGNVIGTTLICGQEESAGHTHSDACYTTTSEQVLTCELEESEGHTHTDECYETEKTLSCGKKEIILHTHGAGCFDQYGNLICTKTEVREHQHDADCYPVVEQTIETPHEHTDVCYTTVYTCNMPEHKHVDDCFVDPNATAEPEATAAPAGAPGMGGMGGPEIFDEYYTPATTGEPETAGEPETTAEPETTGEPETAGEPETTGEPEATTEPETTVEPETTGEPEATTEPEATAEPEAVQGPVLICGKEEHTHVPECYDGNMDLICGKYTHVHSEECYAPMPDGAMEEPGIEDGIMPTALDDGLPSFNQYVDKNVEYEAKYDPSEKEWSVHFNMNFSVPGNAFTEKPMKFRYDFPDNVTIPDKEVTVHDYPDRGYSCEIKRDADGHYYGIVTFYDNFVAGQEVTGDLSFTGTGKEWNTNEDLKFELGDDVTVDIPSKNVEWETDIYVDKKLSTKYDPETHKLEFTVDVWSKDGTGSDITLDDILGLTGGVTVKDVHVKSVVKKQYMLQNGTGHSNAGTPVPEGDGGYKFEDKGNGSFTMTLPPLAPPYYGSLDGYNSGDLGEMYTVVYEYTLDNVKPGTDFSATNTATAKNEEEKADRKEFPFNFSVEVLDKAVELENGLLKWTITVNKDHQNITGWRLTDDYFKANNVTPDQLIIEGGVKGVDYQIVEDGEGGFYIEFLSSSGENKNSYTITYYTTPGFGTNTYKNNATLDPTPNTPGDEYHDSTEKTVTGGGVTKEMTDVNSTDGNGILSWHSQFQIPAAGIPKDTEFSDELTGEWGGEHWMTKTQVQELKGKCSGGVWDSIGDWKFVDKDGKTYTNVDDIPDDAHIVKFTFKALNDIKPQEGKTEDQVDLYYNSTITSTESGKYVNKFAVGDVNTSVTYEGKKPVEKSHDGGNEIEVDEDGLITWKVTINFDQDYNGIKITDYLPEGVVLDSLKYKTSGKANWWEYVGTIADNGDITTYHDGQPGGTGHYDKDGRQLTLEINDPSCLQAGEYITLTYTCKITDPDILEHLKDHTAEWTSDPYENKITVSFDDKKTSGDTDVLTVKPKQEKEEDRKAVGKYADDVNDNLITYRVDINTGAKEYGDEDQLTLEDVLEYFCEMQTNGPIAELYNQYANFHYYQNFGLEGAVKLFYAQTDESGKPILDANGRLVKGDEVPPEKWSWVYDEEYLPTKDINRGNNLTPDGYKDILTVKIPNKTALILEYAYRATVFDPHLADPHKPDEIITPTNNINISASNTATLVGVDKGENTKNFDWHESSFDMNVYTNGLKIYKVETGNYGVKIPNTQFTLFQYPDETNGVIKAQTNSNGVLSLYKAKDNSYYVEGIIGEGTKQQVTLQPNALYYWEETAPAGGHTYEDPNAKPRVYFWYSDGTMDEATFRSTNDLDPSVELLELSARAHNVYIENEKTVEYVLPETGGSGTLWYTIAGAMIFGFGAVFSMIQRKRLGVGRR